MKSSRFVLGAMMLLAVVVFAAPLLAGDLNPPSTAVDQSGNPIPTMQTLETPAPWSQVIPNGANRFKLVMGGAGVLDKETGLVWEQSPDTTLMAWADALPYCPRKLVGNRNGWRLPTFQELASLVDPSVSSSPKLSAGYENYFTSFQSATHWSATTSASDTSHAWPVNFATGYVGTADKTRAFYVLCVRGGSGLEAQ